jgi:hypothetical protein
LIATFDVSPPSRMSSTHPTSFKRWRPTNTGLEAVNLRLGWCKLEFIRPPFADRRNNEHQVYPEYYTSAAGGTLEAIRVCSPPPLRVGPPILYPANPAQGRNAHRHSHHPFFDCERYLCCSFQKASGRRSLQLNGRDTRGPRCRLRVSMRHAGMLIGTAELPQRADGIAAARRTGKECHFLP